MTDKQKLRAELRAARRANVDRLPDAVRGLILLRPPEPIARLTQAAAVVGLYHATPVEAPARSYAKWFLERGCRLVLPWFATRRSPMLFRDWRDPYDDAGLEPGPWGALQPAADATQAPPDLVPDLVFVPVLGFTRDGRRLGQGGGHYDRWLAAHPRALALGLAWDCQLLDNLPQEPHDRPLRAIITPTRIYGDI